LSRPTLVVRFSSLGDVVLCGAVTGGLAPVIFVTSSAWAPVAARLPGVERVVALEPGESLRSLAARLPEHDRRVDLHRSLRSQALSLLLGGVWDTVDPQRLRRQLRVALKLGPARPVVQRYAEAAGVQPAPLPWIRVDGPADALLVVPGAHHATKRWPVDRFAQAAAAIPGPVLVLGGPGEERLCAQLVDAIGPRAERICEAGFEGVLEALGRGRACLAGDTGLAHLCAAAGIPVVTVFGSTHSGDGYWEGRCEPVQLALPCRPCSRFGRARCPIGDLRCLEGLEPSLVSQALSRVIP
jgi:ADP-heptose:LPS heptosyltransferase